MELMVTTDNWTSDLPEIICDVRVDARRVVRGWRTDGAAVARIGSGDTIETTIIDPPGPSRNPEIDRLSRITGAMLPSIAALTPNLKGRPVDIVSSYIQLFKNEGHFAVFLRAFAPSFRHHFRYDEDKGGWSSWVATGRTFLSAFPDVQVKIIDLLAHDDWVIEHNLATGTHTGMFRGLLATNKVVSWSELHVYRMQRGRIIENWPTVDFARLVKNLA
jgi:predicted ester cyclase